MRVVICIAILLWASVAEAQQNPSVACIQRTMRKLEESTAEHPAHVRVMFYGQSITAQAWTQILQQRLCERYPTVKFEFHNAAIGGYDSSVLIRTADHDLYPWYPDLLFFHVYGPMDKYEEIVRRVRERTTAEVVIWTSHLNVVSLENPTEIDSAHDKRAEQIRAVAPKYHCLLIDLREKWRKYLVDHELQAKDLLSDAIHLNPQGCELYAQLIGEELVRAPEMGDIEVAAGRILTIPADSADIQRAADGRVTLRFTGNRVVAISNGKGKVGARAPIWLDGKPMAGVRELWAISRPSVGPAGIWMPAINHIDFAVPLLEEDWTLTCLPDSEPDGSRIHFRVSGSVTGEDGEGWSHESFVSRSQRVSMEPADWRIAWTLGYRQATLPAGFQVIWRSYPMFAATYEVKPTGVRTLLVQGCTNEAHTLTWTEQGEDLGIEAFEVYAPAAGGGETTRR
jgi:hypothetical protein